MTLAELQQREAGQRRTVLELIRAETLQSTPGIRWALKLCREDLRVTRRAMLPEIQELRRASR